MTLYCLGGESTSATIDYLYGFRQPKGVAQAIAKLLRQDAALEQERFLLPRGLEAGVGRVLVIVRTLILVMPGEQVGCKIFRKTQAVDVGHDVPVLVQHEPKRPRSILRGEAYLTKFTLQRWD